MRLPVILAGATGRRWTENGDFNGFIEHSLVAPDCIACCLSCQSFDFRLCTSHREVYAMALTHDRQSRQFHLNLALIPRLLYRRLRQYPRCFFLPLEWSLSVFLDLAIAPLQQVLHDLSLRAAHWAKGEQEIIIRAIHPEPRVPPSMTWISICHRKDLHGERLITLESDISRHASPFFLVIHSTDGPLPKRGRYWMASAI